MGKALVNVVLFVLVVAVSGCIGWAIGLIALKLGGNQ